MNVNRPARIVEAAARQRNERCLHGLGVESRGARLGLARLDPSVVLGPSAFLNSDVPVKLRDAEVTPRSGDCLV